jgi:hypothetical protein
LKNLKKVYLNLSQFGSSANSVQKYLNPLIYESKTLFKIRKDFSCRLSHFWPNLLAHLGPDGPPTLNPNLQSLEPPPPLLVPLRRVPPLAHESGAPSLVSP